MLFKRGKRCLKSPHKGDDIGHIIRLLLRERKNKTNSPLGNRACCDSDQDERREDGAGGQIPSSVLHIALDYKSVYQTDASEKRSVAASDAHAPTLQQNDNIRRGRFFSHLALPIVL